MKKNLLAMLCALMLVVACVFASCGTGSDKKSENDDIQSSGINENKKNELNDGLKEENVKKDDEISEDIEAVKKVIANKKVNTDFAASVKERLAADKETNELLQEARNIKSDNSMLGDWRCVYMDISPVFTQMFAEEGYEIELSEFNVAIILAITEDKMVMTLDMDSIENDFYELADEIITFLGEVIVDELTKNNYTLEEFEEIMGMSLEEFLDNAETTYMEEVASALEEIANSYEAEVVEYEIDGDRIIFGDGTEDTFKLEGNTLTIEGGASEPDIVFTRVGANDTYDEESVPVVKEAENTLEGSYKTTFDMTVIIDNMSVQLEEVTGFPFDGGDFIVTMFWEITDKEFVMTVDADSFDKEVEELSESMKVYMKEALIASALSQGMTEEEFKANMETQTGMSFESAVDTIIDAAIEDSYTNYWNEVKDMSMSMSYKLNGNKLEFSDGSYFTFSFSGSNLIIDSNNPGDSELASMGMEFPWTFVRR